MRKYTLLLFDFGVPWGFDEGGTGGAFIRKYTLLLFDFGGSGEATGLGESRDLGVGETPNRPPSCGNRGQQGERAGDRIRLEQADPDLKSPWRHGNSEI